MSDTTSVKAPLVEAISSSDDLKVVVLYHADCLDGASAAYVALLGLEDAGYQQHEMVFLPVRYNEPPNLQLLKDKEVYILDFSYPVKETEEIILFAANVTMIDHHAGSEGLATLAGIYEDNFTFIHTNAHSGCMLTRQYFYPIDWEDRCPWYLPYVEDRDLWKFEFSDTKAICAYLYSQPLTFSWLQEVAQGNMHAGVAKGKLILAVRGKLIDEVVATAWEAIPGVFIATCPYSLVSEAGEALYNSKPRSIAFLYSLMPDGARKVSLRSLYYDCNKLAKLVGGGGHKAAAGFKVPLADDTIKIILELLQDLPNAII